MKKKRQVYTGLIFSTETIKASLALKMARVPSYFRDILFCIRLSQFGFSQLSLLDNLAVGQRILQINISRICAA
jgi:hypothetical protein